MTNKIIIITALIITFVAQLSYSSTDKKTIYISQIVSHPALDATKEGIIFELKQAGFVANKNLNYKFASAQGDIVLSNQIASNFVSEKPDCIVAIGTAMAQAVVKSSKNTGIPIVFSSITDPLGAKLVTNMDKPEANVTGLSNYIELKQQIDFFKEIIPTLKTIGYIYNPAEANSVKILQDLKQTGIKVVESVAAKTADISQATRMLVNKVDAIFVSNDNTALSAFKLIAKIASEQKIPLFVSDTDLVKDGALASLGPNQYELGRQTGKMVISIFKGTPVRNLAVEFPAKIEARINQKTAKLIGVKFSPKILATAISE